MSGKRLRVPLELSTPGEHDLPQEAASYVVNVHRLAAGDEFLAFDPTRRIECKATVVEVRKGYARVLLAEFVTGSCLPLRHITLVQGVGKGDKMDAVVRDATELGVSEIFPAITERSVVRLDADSGKLKRWRKIAVEAARQCGRSDVPTVHEPVLLTALFDSSNRTKQVALPQSTTGFCFAPEALTFFGTELVQLPKEGPLACVIGPEGGLSESEVRMTETYGYKAVSLGRLILRTETACAAILGAINAFSAR